MTREEYSKKLEPFVPPNTSLMITEWVFQRRINLKITKGRKTKLGDFKTSYKKGYIPSISVNGDLNIYSFLITLIHEFAHAQVYEKYGNRVKPHGAEWKKEYQQLMQPYLINSVFPQNLLNILLKHFENPKASSHADTALVKALSQFDTPKETPLLRLEDLNEGDVFIISGKKLVKGAKRRTRYMCYSYGNARKRYTVSALAEVELIS